MELQEAFSLFNNYINNALQQHLSGKTDAIPAIELPELDGNIFGGRQLNHYENIILLTALAVHVQSSLFDNAIKRWMPKGGDFPEFGGVKGMNTRYMLPTGDTVVFLLAGNDFDKRRQVLRYLGNAHWFYTENVLRLEAVKDGEPRMSGRLVLQQEYVDLLTTGDVLKPSFGPDFPAKLVTTKMEWDDLIITAKTSRQLADIKTWMNHSKTLLNDWQMSKKIKPGFRALFYGPAGTGKTLTATLLGKQFDKDVYKIDLSQVVSKYIGETEKNLEKIFEKAEHKNWILFFDEADALFGKRSNVQNAHDKYANQEVSYLLQRVEDFPGLIILASNFRSNIDQAFIRRFNAVIHFPMPTQQERMELWQKSLPPTASYADDVDLSFLAGKYELSGSAIMNVMHYAALNAIAADTSIIFKTDLLEGIRREYEKEERAFVG